MTMKNMGKRVLSLLLSLTMLLTLLPVPALAADNGDFRGEELDTAEVYNWLVENYVDADEETGAIFVPAGQLGLYLAFPDAPGNEGRKVDMFTLWTEIDGGYAALQLRPDEFMDSLEDEDAAMVAIYETGEAYLMMGTPDIILEEDPLAVPEEIPVLPEENPVIPEETPALPEETPEAPEETPALPEETPEAPEETPEAPEETPEVPEETPETPEETPDASDETADVSDETEEDSDETADVSDETEEDSGEEVMTSLQNASGKLPVSLWVRYGGKGLTDELVDELAQYGYKDLVDELPEEVTQLRKLLDEMEAFQLTLENERDYWVLGSRAMALMEALEDVEYEGKEDDMARFQALADKQTGGAEVLADYTIKVGETLDLKGTSRKASSHNWSSNDESVATVSSGSRYGQTSDATVSGVAEGTVTITHSYYQSSGWSGDWKSETFTVKVEANGPATTGTAPVYFYAQYSNDGWRWIGTGSVEPVVPPIKNEQSNTEVYGQLGNDNPNNNHLYKAFYGQGDSRNEVFVSANDKSMLTYPEWMDLEADGRTYVHIDSSSPDQKPAGGGYYYTFEIAGSKTNEGFDPVRVVEAADNPNYTGAPKLESKYAIHADGIATLYVLVNFEVRDEQGVDAGGQITGNDWELIAIGSAREGVAAEPVSNPEFTANAGYGFSHWEDAAGNDLGKTLSGQKVSAPGTYYAIFDVLPNLGYVVEYYKDGVRVDADTQREEQQGSELGQTNLNVDLTKINTTDKYEGFALDKLAVGDSEVAALPTNVATGTTIKVYYATDVKGGTDPEKPGDGTPDKYQVTVKYVSANPKQGTVNGVDAVEEVLTIRDEQGNLDTSGNVTTTKTVTAAAADTYEFVDWTDGSGKAGWTDNKNTTNSLSSITLSGVEGGSPITFTANWKTKMVPYSVEYYLDGDEAVSNPPYEGAPTGGSVEIGKGTNVTDFLTTIEREGASYVLDHIEQVKAATEAGDNVVKVYYLTDADRNGTPDEYEFTVAYVAAPDDAGSVSKASEKVALYEFDEESMKWNRLTAITIRPNVTATPDVGFKVTGWTDEAKVSNWLNNEKQQQTITEIEFADVETLEAKATYTFKAHFAEDTYTVRWQGMGGSWNNVPENYTSDGKVPAKELSQVLVPNDGVKSPETPVRYGYRFNGWYCANAKVSYSTSVNPEGETIYPTVQELKDNAVDRTIIMQAQWAPAESYKVIQHFVGLDGETIRQTEVLELDADKTVEDMIAVYQDNYTANETKTVIGDTLPVNYLYDEDKTQKKPDTTEVGFVTVVDLYYDVDSWNKNTPSEDTGDGIADKYQVKVTFTASDGGYVDGETVQVFTDKEADQVTFTPVKVTPEADDGYAFDKWTENGSDVDPFTERAVNGGTEITYLANFAGDKNKDGTPDKYQAEVTYKVVNGVIKDTNLAEKTVYVTLFDKDNNWAPIPANELKRQIPELTANKGFEGGKWDNNPATAILKEEEHDTFTYTFDAKNLTYSVRYWDSSTETPVAFEDEAGNHLVKVVEVPAGTDYVIWAYVQKDHPLDREGYVYDGVKVPVVNFNDDDADYFDVYYAKDVKGGTEPGKGDGTADKYQVTVEYVSADQNMGTVSGRTSEVVTIEGKKTSGSALMHGSDAAAESGYFFTKWTAENLPEGNQKEYTSSWLQSAWLVNVKGGETYTIKANFAENVYTVVFNGNGGTWDAETSKKFEKLAADAMVTAPEAPKWVDASKTFAGWKLGNADFDATKTVSELWEQAGKPKNCTIEVTADWETVQLNYSVVQKFRDESADVIFTSEPVYSGSADYGTSYADLVKAEYKSTATYKEVEYLYDTTSIQDRKLTEDGAQIELYYDVDSWNKNGPSETGGDGFADKYQVLVKFVSEDDENKGTVEGKVTQVFGPMADTNADIPVKPDYVTPNAKEGFAFDVWKKDGSIVNPFTFRNVKGGTKLTYTACFGTDEKGPNGTSDKIPDKYQAEVTYNVVNGTITGTSDVTRTVLVTLFAKNNDGMWEAIANPDRQIPNLTATKGYKAGGWLDKKNPETDTLVVLPDTNVFTYQFTEDDIEYTVEYYFDGVKGTAPDGATTGGTLEFGQVTTVAPKTPIDHNDHHYILESVENVEIKANVEENVVKVYYVKDEIGITDPTEPDGTADKYQVTVNYVAGQNGSLEGGKKTEVLTIPGEKQTSGRVTLNAPAPKANEFYHFVDWKMSDVSYGTKLTTLSVTGGTTYTFTANFAENVYTVIFDANGGSIGSASQVEKKVPASKTLGALVGEVGNPENAGSEFLGWQYTDVNGREDFYNRYQANMTVGRFWKATNGKEDDLTAKFTAQWKTIPLTYGYVQHFVAANGSEQTVTVQPGNILPYGTEIATILTEKRADTTYNGQKYLYDATQFKATNGVNGDVLTDEVLTVDGTVLHFYYNVDSWGSGTETGGDTTPDKDQVLVKFESDANGKVDGNLIQVFKANEAFTPASVETEPASGYAFDKWTKDGGSEAVNPFEPTTAKGGTKITFKANFAEDKKGGPDPENPGDGTPDKYQATVTYQVVNGTWDGEVNADKKVVVTLYKKDETTGQWEPIPVPEQVRGIPATKYANPGYKIPNPNTWKQGDNEVDLTTVKITSDTTFTYTYVLGELPYEIRYFYDGVEDPAEVMKGWGQLDQTVSPGFIQNETEHDGKHYVLDSEDHTIKISADVEKNVIKVYYALDEKGPNPDPEEKGDGIADKYQVIVYFQTAGNGTLEGTTTQAFGNKGDTGSISYKPETVTPKAETDYAFDIWTMNGETEEVNPFIDRTANVGTEVTFTAHFEQDTVKDPEQPGEPDPEKPGDNIPDKYQAVLVYRIENGTWSDGSTEIRVNVTLKKQNEDGSWTPVDPEPDRQIPNGTPNGGYRVGGWDIDPEIYNPLAVATEKENVFTYHCVPLDTRILTIRYVDEDGTEIQASTRRTLVEGTLPILVNASSISGYVAIGETSRVITALADQTITFTYARDVLSDPNRDGNGSEPGDGIPDSMQYEVTYTATNGTVSIASTVVTKLDGNGEPSADGIARLAANQVATATRVSTVYSAIPTWTPRVPVADLVITENTAFNANFTTAGGGGGGTGGGTGGGGGGTTIPDPTVPLADEAVPLAGDVMLNLDDHFAYIKGYADGTVRPNNFITRAQVATIFYRLMTAESRAIYFAESNDYSDVASDFWANKAISTLSNAEIITGFSDGTFRPNAYITRAQFAAIAARFDSVVPGLENPFSDVSEEHWAHDLIAYAASKGWIGGYDDGTFRPNNNITRAAAMNLINNVLQRHVDEEGLLEDATQWSDNKPGDWHYYVVLEATNSHDYDRREEGELMENWTALTPDPEWDE